MKIDVIKIFYDNRSKTQICLATNEDIFINTWDRFEQDLKNANREIKYKYIFAPNSATYFYISDKWLYIKTIDLPESETEPNQYVIDYNDPDIINNIYPTFRVRDAYKWIEPHDIVKVKKRCYLSDKDRYQTKLSDRLRQILSDIYDLTVIAPSNIQDAKNWENYNFSNQIFEVVNIQKGLDITKDEYTIYTLQSLTDDGLLLKAPPEFINTNHGIITGSSIIKEKWHYVQ